MTYLTRQCLVTFFIMRMTFLFTWMEALGIRVKLPMDI